MYLARISFQVTGGKRFPYMNIFHANIKITLTKTIERCVTISQMSNNEKGIAYSVKLKQQAFKGQVTQPLLTGQNVNGLPRVIMSYRAKTTVKVRIRNVFLIFFREDDEIVCIIYEIQIITSSSQNAHSWPHRGYQLQFNH